MRIGLLGPVTAGADGAPAPGGPLLRGLLARLALDVGRTVDTSTLVDALWGDERPGPNALQAMVSRLRRALGADVVVTVPGGYRLALDRDAVDAVRFTALVAEARGAREPGAAHALFRRAVGLWRGPALADVRRLPFAEPAAVRLEEQRATALELAAAAALRLGEPDAELDALHALLATHPLRESTAVALARGLQASDRQVEALAVLDRTRRRLADELGVDPGAELTATRLAVLRERPARPRPGPPQAVPRPGPPPALTSFVGRRDDLARAHDRLAADRLLTLIGPGGAGKTRLAVEVARALPGEVRIAELAPLGGPTAAPTPRDAGAPGRVGRPRPPVELTAAVLAAVRPADIVSHAPTDDIAAQLDTALDGRELLLVLDNCEHVVGAAATLVHTLLGRHAGLRVLATSRAPLGVPGEVLHPVDALADDDAVRLFAERGATVRPGFAVTATNRAAVHGICRRLDGQPLAIELAAARLRTLTPEEIHRRLDDRFRLLTTGARTAEPRHQTLRAVVDWSWDLLDGPERALARRLAVFVGGATEEAARAVCGLGEATFDVLAALVDKSLVVAHPADPTRYRMLETVRAYAALRLDEAGERTAVEAAHTAAVLELAETAEPHLRRPGQLAWVARLRATADDVAAVLRRALAARDADTAQRLVAATAWYGLIRGLFGEAEDRLAAACALDDAPQAPPATRALCAAYRAMAAAGEGDFAVATRHLADAERLADGLPPERHPVLALMGPVAAGFAHDDPAPLERLAADPDADPWARAFARFCRGQLAENAGDRERQRTEIRAAHAGFAALGDRWGLGMTVSSLGDLESVAGDLDAAERAFDEAIALAQELGNADDLPQFETVRAGLRVRRGDVAGGRAELRRILARPGLHPELVAHLHQALADAARRAGDLDEARRALARADPDGVPGPGAPQRRALHAVTTAAVAAAAGAPAAAVAALAAAVAHAEASADGPVTAAVAEHAAAHALAGGDARTAADLLGVAVAQRGTLDVGDPEVRATLDAVRAALGDAATDAVIARNGRSRARTVAVLRDYVRGAAAGSGGDGADSASATSRA